MTPTRLGKRTRLTLGLTAVIGGVLATGISSAGAAGLFQINPATVPNSDNGGELVLAARAHTPFTLEVGGHEQDFRKGAEITVEHDTFPAGATSGWHDHPGVVFVSVVQGTLTAYQGKDEDCKGKKYGPGTGFVEPATVVHDVRNETSGTVEIYVTYVLPPGTGQANSTSKPDGFNEDCPFAN